MKMKKIINLKEIEPYKIRIYLKIAPLSAEVTDF